MSQYFMLFFYVYVSHHSGLIIWSYFQQKFLYEFLISPIWRQNGKRVSRLKSGYRTGSQNARMPNMVWGSQSSSVKRLKLSMSLLALDRKQCRLVPGLHTGYCTLWWCLHSMGLSWSTMCRKCGYREESFYHMFHQCPNLARHRIETSVLHG
jgi:hypothetical protein